MGAFPWGSLNFDDMHIVEVLLLLCRSLIVFMTACYFHHVDYLLVSY